MSVHALQIRPALAAALLALATASAVVGCRALLQATDRHEAATAFLRHREPLALTA